MHTWRCEDCGATNTRTDRYCISCKAPFIDLYAEQKAELRASRHVVVVPPAPIKIPAEPADDSPNDLPDVFADRSEIIKGNTAGSNRSFAFYKDSQKVCELRTQAFPRGLAFLIDYQSERKYNGKLYGARTKAVIMDRDDMSSFWRGALENLSKIHVNAEMCLPK